MSDKQQLPIDADGVCMMCGEHPAEEDKLICTICASPWHPSCVAERFRALALASSAWECPDCSGAAELVRSNGVVFDSSSRGGGGGDTLVGKMREIEADESLSAEEKARKRQELMMNGSMLLMNGDDDGDEVDENLKCCCCMHLLVKPISMSCGHNACLKCFQGWVNKGNHTCMTCRHVISKSIISLPRINASLVEAIRFSKSSSLAKAQRTTQAYQSLDNDNRPDTAFTTERAQRKGRSNAASGRVFIKVPEDHFGPILPEHDPVRNRGVLVGDKWADRLDCRQWAVHRPHVAGIAGQAEYGAQSVVLSGGYEDDEDYGEWFLYTGSGGRDLSGNKRTNKLQSFDQSFTKYNAALRRSCLKGYPVRVVSNNSNRQKRDKLSQNSLGRYNPVTDVLEYFEYRSSKEKRSSYAPEKDKEKDQEWYRYDGIYRIEKCWMKVGVQNFRVCRFLFVRCDNAPAPWSSDDHGDLPRMLPVVAELAQAENVIERSEDPSWDFNAEERIWKWGKPPPPSLKPVKGKHKNKKLQPKTAVNQLRKAFSCRLCEKVLSLPVTTPCAHNFCKPCLEDAFSGQSQVRERSGGGRSLRSKKNVFKCPSCTTDVSEFLKSLQVNRELESAIEVLKKQVQDGEEPHENKEDDSVLDEDSCSTEEEDGDSDEKDEEPVEEVVMDISSPKRQKLNDYADQQASPSSVSENLETDAGEKGE